jgi:hypothetical protein
MACLPSPSRLPLVIQLLVASRFSSFLFLHNSR